MTTASTIKGVIRRYEQSSKEIREYFPALPSLLKQFSWDVIVGYLFARVEAAKHMSIYCGIVKLHQGDAELTWSAVVADYFSRSRFRELVQTVFGKSIPRDLLKKLSDAEKIRDKVMHGKPFRDAEGRQAVVDIIEFAEGFNDFVYSTAQFKPFGKYTGFKGRMKPLGKSTTRWILKGMSFSVS